MLMERVEGAGLKAVVKAVDMDKCESIDKFLWDYAPNSFLPHDKLGCDHPVDQMIYITTQEENPNHATCIVLVDAVECESYQAYDRLLYMFDGRDPDIVSKARLDWKKYSEGGYSMSYWQQSEMGGWEKKA